MSFSKVVSDLRQTFGSGRTRDVEWRVRQLTNLLKFYEENSDLFVEAIKKDLRKPKWESLSTEINYLRNDVVGCLRDVRAWVKPIKTEKSIMTLLDDCVIRPGTKLNTLLVWLVWLVWF
jgi:aldehyde dehydrogenase (NAD+)